MPFQLADKSRARLVGVHPDLVRVVERAAGLCSIEFIVVEGVRTLEKQKEYFEAGKSRTMNSRHLAKEAKGVSGLVSHAVDLCPRLDTDGDGALELSWKLSHFLPVRDAMVAAARKEGVAIIWGADWDNDGDYKDEKFVDAPHFELDRKFYP